MEFARAEARNGECGRMSLSLILRPWLDATRDRPRERCRTGTGHDQNRRDTTSLMLEIHGGVLRAAPKPDPCKSK